MSSGDMFADSKEAAAESVEGGEVVEDNVCCVCRILERKSDFVI